MSQTIQCCPKCGFPFVHCICKPVTLDDIKRSIRHDHTCVIERPFPDIEDECNCTRRDKIALLERLEEPTQHMKDELMDWLLDTGNIYLRDETIVIETAIVADFTRHLLKAAELEPSQ